MSLVLDLLVAGAMLCAETDGLEVKVGRKAATRERAIIAQVAISHWREEGGALAASLRRNLFAVEGCSGRPVYRARLARVFREVFQGKRKVPAWAKKARAFTTKAAAKKVLASWRARGYEPVQRTRTVHVFWRRTTGAAPAPERRAKARGGKRTWQR